MNDLPDTSLLKAADVRRLLRVSESLVYQMAARGQLPSVQWEQPSKVGKPKMTIRFRREDIEAFIKQHHRGSPLTTNERL